MKSISVILPIFNEKKSLLHVVEAWSAFFLEHKIEHEILLCEDGSTDGTKELIIQICQDHNAVNLSTLERRGYGGGVIAGINAASKELILSIDSDGQCMPDSFMDIYNIEKSSDIVIGIRAPRHDPIVRRIYSLLFLGLFRLLFRGNIKDPSCPYVLAKKEVFMELMPYLKMKEGFWWCFIGAATKLNKNINQCNIIHYERYDGSTVVYKLSRMPSIIIRNILGLIMLRLSK
jgi:dolichol-phosphate mannosyltransferase